MRVFVLNSGRCGSTTFAKAAAHLTNYTAGHESNAGLIGPPRMDYPDMHVEADNRLAWLLGQLHARYGDDAFYVHLRRSTDATAESFLRRWNYQWRGGVIEAFAHGILMHAGDWDESDRLAVCRYYVETVNNNIADFLSRHSRTAVIDLETASRDFAVVWDAIGAEGDLDAALREWQTTYNAS